MLAYVRLVWLFCLQDFNVNLSIRYDWFHLPNGDGLLQTWRYVIRQQLSDFFTPRPPAHILFMSHWTIVKPLCVYFLWYSHLLIALESYSWDEALSFHVVFMLFYVVLLSSSLYRFTCSQVQEVTPITSFDVAGTNLLLGCRNGTIYYIDMQKFPLRMKDNDLLITELFHDVNEHAITALSVYVSPTTSKWWYYFVWFGVMACPSLLFAFLTLY